MKSRVLGILVMSLSGCAHDNMSFKEKVVPPAELQTLTVEKIGGGYRINAGGVEEYVREHGARGWIAGLTDARPASAALSDAAAETPSEVRVKDVFCYYYWNKTGRRPELAWPRHSTTEQRDEVIGRMTAELE